MLKKNESVQDIAKKVGLSESTVSGIKWRTGGGKDNRCKTGKTNTGYHALSLMREGHNDVAIAEVLGVSKQRINVLRKDALKFGLV